MQKRKPDITAVANRKELAAELTREKQNRQAKGSIGKIIRVVAAVAGVAAVIATFILPVLRIDGNSMSETLSDGDITVAVRFGGYDTGDIIAFYHNNDILIKRVIAKSGQWVDIDEYGVVTVDGKVLDEPYVTNPSLGETTIELPYQVPEGRLFVMGDHRDTSIDSRNGQVGPVREELVIGRITMRIWPILSTKLF